jgi:hypothetical protein
MESKIKKNIKAVYFMGEKTKVLFRERFKPRDHNEVVNEETPRKSDFARHRHFNDAMAVMAVHLLVRLGLTEPTDRMGQLITLENNAFFTDNIYLDDKRYKNVEITSVQITTKDDASSFKIFGILTTPDGMKQKINCPSFSTLKATDGSWNYPLIDFAQIHLETLLIEALEWIHYKSDQYKIPFEEVENGKFKSAIPSVETIAEKPKGKKKTQPVTTE